MSGNQSAARIHELETTLAAARLERDNAWRELDELARYLSHDLRAPLRGINGYSQALFEDYQNSLDPLAQAYLGYITESGRLAVRVLDKLIQYIRVPRAELNLQTIDLSGLAEEILDQIQQRSPGNADTSKATRTMHRKIEPKLTVIADERMARVLLETLLENAWIFTAKRATAEIVFGSMNREDEKIFFIQDNGAGFDPSYVDRLFQPFQRLHSAHEFEGAGMGLAVARRIVERHAGRIWARGEVDHGATLFFTVGQTI